MRGGERNRVQGKGRGEKRRRAEERGGEGRREEERGGQRRREEEKGIYKSIWEERGRVNPQQIFSHLIVSREEVFIESICVYFLSKYSVPLWIENFIFKLIILDFVK